MTKPSPWGKEEIAGIPSTAILDALHSDPTWKEKGSMEIEGEIGEAIIACDRLFEGARGGSRVEFSRAWNVALEAESLSSKVWDYLERYGASESLWKVYTEKIEPLKKEAVIDAWIDALIAGNATRRP